MGKIPNHSLKASSTLNKYHKPGYGRLNTVIEGGAWCARESHTSQYFQVDLIEIHKISNIVLQGKNSGPAEGQGWVTKFAVTYSNDGIVWSQHVEEGLAVCILVSKYFNYRTVCAINCNKQLLKHCLLFDRLS